MSVFCFHLMSFNFIVVKIVFLEDNAIQMHKYIFI